MICPVCGGATVKEPMPGIHGISHTQERCTKCGWVGPPVFGNDDDDGPGADTDTDVN